MVPNLMPKRKQFSPSEIENFLTFYKAFWLHKGRKDAEQAYIKLAPSPELHSAIMEAVRLQTPEMLRKAPEYRPYPATWLRARRWEDAPMYPPRPIAESRPNTAEAERIYQEWFSGLCESDQEYLKAREA